MLSNEICFMKPKPFTMLNMGHGVDDQQGGDHHWRAHQDLTDRQGRDQQGRDCCGREHDQQGRECRGHAHQDLTECQLQDGSEDDGGTVREADRHAARGRRKRVARAAVVVGQMGPSVLGKDKLKRPKRWSARGK